MPEHDPELEPHDSGTGTDPDSELDDALRSLREALDGSLQLSRMIAELEKTLAERSADPARMNDNDSEDPVQPDRSESQPG